VRLLATALVVCFAACSNPPADPDAGVLPDATTRKPCTGPSDCAPTEFCDNGFCEPTGCATACGEDELCVAGQCKNAEGLVCYRADDCPAAFKCALGRCTRKCTLNRDCASGVCNADLQICAECNFDTDCKTAPFNTCWNEYGRCVQCVEPGPGESSDCPLRSFCHPDDHVCVGGCRKDKLDCPVVERCVGATDTEPGRCVECTPETEDADCPNGRCDPATSTCVQCLENIDCGQLKCRQSDHACVECLGDLDCAMAWICNANFCAPGCRSDFKCPPEGQANILLTRCQADYLPNGRCVQCLSDTQCPLGWICNNDGRCIEGCRAGPPPARCPSFKPYCQDRPSPEVDQCVGCLSNTNCSGTTPICDAEDWVCRCAGVGDACTANAQCGWKPSSRSCTASAVCVVQVKCLDGRNQAMGSPSRCGTFCSNPGSPTGCPSGYKCQQVVGIDGVTYNYQCVYDTFCR
jgi:hypothetical protein